MEYPEIVISQKEAGQVVLDAMTSDNTQKVFEKESSDFKRGAIWGMAWAATHIMAKCTQYRVEFNVPKSEYRHPRDETPPYK